MILNQTPPELFSERPVRSVMEEEGGWPSYRARRIITITVLLGVIGGGLAVAYTRPTTPMAVVEVPVIKADIVPYKQRPQQPGGMDIPHQDMEVYRELEGKTQLEAKPGEEKMLPTSESPLPEHINGQVQTDFSAPTIMTTPKTELLTGVPVQQNEPDLRTSIPNSEPALPQVAQAAASPVAMSSDMQVPAASVIKTPDIKQKSVVEPAGQSLETHNEKAIDSLANKNNSVSQKSPEVKQGEKTAESFAATLAKVTTPAKTKSVVQFASLPNQEQAKLLLNKLAKQYASLLDGAELRIVRADLGGKGIYYRIQSAPVTPDQANHICAALKQQHAGCFIVRP